MSGYTWYADFSVLPAEQVAATHFPFRPRFQGSVTSRCRTGQCGKGWGMQMAYPKYENSCERGACGAPLMEPCKRAAFESTYYHPNGVAFSALPFGTSTGTCYPSFGCLNPRAQSFDKLAHVHCDGMCMYKQPRVCVKTAEAYAVNSAAQKNTGKCGCKKTEKRVQFFEDAE